MIVVILEHDNQAMRMLTCEVTIEFKCSNVHTIIPLLTLIFSDGAKWGTLQGSSYVSKVF